MPKSVLHYELDEVSTLNRKLPLTNLVPQIKRLMVDERNEKVLSTLPTNVCCHKDVNIMAALYKMFSCQGGLSWIYGE